MAHTVGQSRFLDPAVLAGTLLLAFLKAPT